MNQDRLAALECDLQTFGGLRQVGQGARRMELMERRSKEATGRLLIRHPPRRQNAAQAARKPQRAFERFDGRLRHGRRRLPAERSVGKLVHGMMRAAGRAIGGAWSNRGNGWVPGRALTRWASRE